jgi:hypothetical protein
MSDKLAYYLVGGSESSFPPPVTMTDVHDDFVRQIQAYLPDNPVKFVELGEVREGLYRGVEMAQKEFPDAALVSLSSLYYPTAEFQLSANRIVSVTKQDLGLGPRPRSDPLRQQVDAVMAKVGNRPVVTVDDTLFQGHTLSLLLGMGMRVNAAVEYFTKQETVGMMAAKGVRVFTVVNEESYKDVMPMHDFLPPLPLCGKVVGHVVDDELTPLIENGMSYSVPYLMPWITPLEMSDWASIPEEYAADFSRFALRWSLEVAERLWGHGFSSLANAVKYQPLRTSVPYLAEDKPNVEGSVYVMLERYLHLVEQQ